MSNSNEDNKENEARQNQVKEYLESLEFREIYGDLISSCVVRNIRVVGDYLYLKLFLGSDQIKLKKIIENKLKIFSWAKKVYLDLKFIEGVKRTIAIGSGKGGVGKSSVTVGLALNLKKRGFKVGILDADVYGPNIPNIIGLSKQDVLTKEENGKVKFCKSRNSFNISSTIEFIVCINWHSLFKKIPRIFELSYRRKKNWNFIFN